MKYILTFSLFMFMFSSYAMILQGAYAAVVKHQQYSRNKNTSINILSSLLHPLEISESSMGSVFPGAKTDNSISNERQECYCTLL